MTLTNNVNERLSKQIFSSESLKKNFEDAFTFGSNFLLPKELKDISFLYIYIQICSGVFFFLFESDNFGSSEARTQSLRTQSNTIQNRLSFLKKKRNMQHA